MQTHRKWEVLSSEPPKSLEEIQRILLQNRNINTKEEVENFINPKIEDVNAKSVEIDGEQLKSAVKRIRQAIEKKEQIIIFGDYDVDGICGTAILWETLNAAGAKVSPYIPNRIEEGYGLSIAGITNIKKQFPDTSLIITVDNGIVACAPVDFANSQNIDVIITDHHTLGPTLPNAVNIVHTTKLCGTGVAWILSKEFEMKLTDHLDLVALATVADLVPLVNSNRTLLKFGLKELHETKRVGLLCLFEEAGIEKEKIDTYEIGHVIAPRLNAMGRLEDAMDSLRLICTKDIKRAKKLAQLLSDTNKERQDVTKEATIHATSLVRENKMDKQKLLFVVHESYEPGVIGLVAGKLVEEFYRPSIVLSKGEKVSKASARSIYGFNIIDFIRQSSEFLVDAGGHPMAAGFTVENENLDKLQKKFEELAEGLLNDDHFIRNLRIDSMLGFNFLDFELLDSLVKLSPYGMANPQPVFATEKVEVLDIKLVGKEGKHAKFFLSKDDVKISAIGFGMGDQISEIHIGDEINIAYSIDDDNWNGNRRMQLRLKDLRF